jgi:2-(1,2-epoxy-1,2-dihydrophenyl)acetyl-CoA isomerase
MADELLVERAGAVVTLTLNRPESLNSLDVALKEALRDTLAALAGDQACRALVLTGAGRAFCVGQDLRQHAESLERADTPPLSTVVEHYNPIVTHLSALPVPVVAAVRGSAAGAGMGLALLCDFRIGGPSTSMVTAFAGVGLAADTGMSYSLPRLVGHAKAVELLMLGGPVRADEALRLGLLTSLVDSDDEVLPAAQALAGRLADGPTAAYGQIKKELSVAAAGTLADALAAEAAAQAHLGATTDHRAATAAFVAKQRPSFTGR